MTREATMSVQKVTFLRHKSQRDITQSRSHTVTKMFFTVTSKWKMVLIIYYI